MRKFHSTVSRRDFMKGLGFGVAGIGIAGAASPVIHDLDELMSSSEASQKRPWYVREREHEDPTVEIDWEIMSRYDGRLSAQAAHTNAIYYGKERVLAASGVGNQLNAQRRANNEPGYRMRDDAMYASITAMWGVGRGTRGAGDYGWAGDNPINEGARYAPTPEEQGIAKWTGTPEEASKMLRAVLRLAGSSLVGYSEVNSNTRNKLWFTHEKGGANSSAYIDNWPPPDNVARPIVYEDVDKAYETDTKLVVPTKQLYEISVTQQGSNELFRACFAWAGAANRATFAHQGSSNGVCFNFLRGLGYQLIGTIGNDARYLGCETPGGILSGIGEMSRQSKYVLTPEYGTAGRLYNVATDLPLEPTPPIDAGMYRFCHTCHKCANACPPQVISQESESTFEPGQVESKDPIFHRLGPKALWNNFSGCRMFIYENGGCNQCWGECTFAVNSGAMAHGMAKATVSTTSLFNGFLWRMGDVFGYGDSNEKAEQWWNLNLPIYGIDSTRPSTDGGYKK